VDEIAYNTADLDDAREAGLLNFGLLLKEVPVFGELYSAVESAFPEAREKLKFNEALKRVLDLLATDLIEATRRRVAESGAASVDEVRRAPRRLAGFSEAVAARNAELKRFLYTHVYNRAAITRDRDRSVRFLEELFLHYLEHPEALPESYAELARQQQRHIVVCDYIAGMTDQFLLRRHRDLFGSTRRATI
jgi:dGTPase